jgi:MoaA/NifB/PqqE/SkfB family radical SAM enzyme
MLKYQDVRQLEIEITTHCNAACPQCPRNHHGGATIKSLPNITWTLNDVKQLFDVQFVKQLEMLYLCGTYGDAMSSEHVVDIVQWFKDINPDLNISLHTNGSIGRADTYRALAPLLDFMAFGIDGLEDTNHIYRRRTKWSTIVRNAQAFITAGGTAYWDYIVFQHNEHQVAQAQQLATDLGFAKFNIKKTARFLDRNHQLQPNLRVMGFEGQPEYLIQPPTNPEFQNRYYKNIQLVDLDSYRKTTNITCHLMSEQRIYVGADGYVVPCGWLHDRLYGVEVESGADHTEIYAMMAECGGTHMANAFQTPLKEIVDGAWFNKIVENWETNRLERCAMMCGEKINVIGVQNELLQY